MTDIQRLMRLCIERGASDLHITTGRPPTLRIHGRLRDVAPEPLKPAETEALCLSIVPERLLPELEEKGTVDFAYPFETLGRFRVSVYRQKGFYGGALRLIPTRLLTFEQIGLPEAVKDLLTRPRGLFLVTGPTGSGKTTTLATMIDYINTNFDRHIVTVEDPIEYYHSHKQSIITQRELGSDVPTFAEAMRRALRQDPDVIMLGEMRDLDTIATAITAAETGHLVFGTLHTTGAARTVDRIIDSFPKEQQEQIRTQLALSIVAVLSQVLIPRVDREGVVAAFEFMVNTPAIENHIRKGETFKILSDIQTGKKRGMRLLDDHLLELLRGGRISRESALGLAQNPGEMAERLGAAGQG